MELWWYCHRKCPRNKARCSYIYLDSSGESHLLQPALQDRGHCNLDANGCTSSNYNFIIELPAIGSKTHLQRRFVWGIQWNCYGCCEWRTAPLSYNRLRRVEMEQQPKWIKRGALYSRGHRMRTGVFTRLMNVPVRHLLLQQPHPF